MVYNVANAATLKACWFIGVISAVTERSVALLLTREEAGAFITEVEADEPDLAALLRVEEIEFGSASGCASLH